MSDRGFTEGNTFELLKGLDGDQVYDTLNDIRVSGNSFNETLFQREAMQVMSDFDDVLESDRKLLLAAGMDKVPAGNFGKFYEVAPTAFGADRFDDLTKRQQAASFETYDTYSMKMTDRQKEIASKIAVAQNKITLSGGDVTDTEDAKQAAKDIEADLQISLRRVAKGVAEEDEDAYSGEWG